MTPEQQLQRVAQAIADILTDIAKEEAIHQHECDYGNDCDFLEHSNAISALCNERRAVLKVRDRLFAQLAAESAA